MTEPEITQLLDVQNFCRLLFIIYVSKYFYHINMRLLLRKPTNRATFFALLGQRETALDFYASAVARANRLATAV